MANSEHKKGGLQPCPLLPPRSLSALVPRSPGSRTTLFRTGKRMTLQGETLPQRALAIVDLVSPYAASVPDIA
eukprot:2199330-Rhodomonas_salina.1